MSERPPQPLSGEEMSARLREVPLEDRTVVYQNVESEKFDDNDERYVEGELVPAIDGYRGFFRLTPEGFIDSSIKDVAAEGVCIKRFIPIGSYSEIFPPPERLS